MVKIYTDDPLVSYTTTTISAERTMQEIEDKTEQQREVRVIKPRDVNFCEKVTIMQREKNSVLNRMEQ